MELRSGKALTTEEANAVWDLLVEHAGASKSEDERFQFVYHETKDICPEYRFQGNLGFGGKFWNVGRGWYVNCYTDEETAERRSVVRVTNARLCTLQLSLQFPSAPAVGDQIYVQSAYYISHGEDDFVGGLATVQGVKMGMSGGQDVPYITLVERPGTEYNWTAMAGKQDELKARFGDKTAHPDPDYTDYGERW